MLRALKRRLDRLWQSYERRRQQHDSNDTHRRFVEIVRAGLRRAGLDPAKIHATAVYEPGSIFAGLMKTPQPPPKADDNPTQKLRTDLLGILERHREQPIDVNHASLMELVALYCFVPDAPGVTYLRAETA